MPKIAKAYFYLTDLPARWDHSLSEIAGWALAERLTLMIPIVPVTCGDVVVTGIVRVPAPDIARLFHPDYPKDRPCLVRRIVPADTLEPMMVSAPSEGIEIRLRDLMLTAEEVWDFERVNDLLSVGKNAPRAVGKSVGRVGRPVEYEWEDMIVDVVSDVAVKGLPSTKTGFMKLVLDWFTENSADGSIPDASTVWKRCGRIWWRLQDRF